MESTPAPIQDIKVAVDAVVFGYNSSKGLQVLLIKRNIEPFMNSWALPGGLVLNSEKLEQAVLRELKEEAGISLEYLEQLYTFGAPNRDPRNRAISIAYYGLVKPDIFQLKASTDAKDAKWFAIGKLPELAFDHQHILETAISRLRAKIRYEPIGFDLLDNKFPFSELEKLYAAVLDRPIDRRNFKKKILKYGILVETDERQKHSGAGRPGFLYRFDLQQYNKLKKEGIHFEI